jgi:hypothetical protein
MSAYISAASALALHGENEVRRVQAGLGRQPQIDPHLPIVLEIEI